ncbi:MAG: hypothetical protein PUB01_03275 [Desulfovibrionaceae bacterium]|nr:hypothetical protein [Desulfovibrionaceae bacterium]
MKRIMVLMVAAMLCSSPVLAAGIQSQPSGGNKIGQQQNVINQTNLQNSAVISTGKGTKTEIGTVSNNKGQQQNIINQTKIKNSAVISTGGAETQIGTIKNQ